MTTRLDYYKIHYRCSHDGETVLKAASMGEFSGVTSSHDKVVHIRQSMDGILRELGIKPKMPKRIILGTLRDYQQGNKNLRILSRIVSKEAEKIRAMATDLLSNVRPHPSVEDTYEEDALIEVARMRVMAIINQVISFCEDDVSE